MCLAMPLVYLDHVNLRTANVTGLVEFYTAVLGLTLGNRPAFSFGGAWLYCGDRAVVHLVEVEEPPNPSGELRLEHFAFVAQDYDALVRTLESRAIPYRASKQFGSETRQINLRDPDGNRVHVDFPEG